MNGNVDERWIQRLIWTPHSAVASVLSGTDITTTASSGSAASPAVANSFQMQLVNQFLQRLALGVDRLLKERLALAGVARVAQVWERGLQYDFNQKYYRTPKQVQTSKKNRVAWLWRWMRCGHFWEVKIAQSGCGRRLTKIRA